MENRDMNLFDFILLCCKAIGRFFKSLVGLGLQALRLCFQYIWIFVTCVILGVVGGWLWTKPFATMFKGNATVMYAEGMREVVREGIIDFLMLSKEEKMNYGLTEEAFGSLEAFYIYNVIDCNADSVADYVDRDGNVNLADTLNLVMRDRVHLEVEMLGNRDFKPFEIALTNYFNSQSYLVAAYERCKVIQQERLDYFTKEVARLDSFSTYDYFVRPRSVIVEEQDGLILGSKQNLYYDAVMAVMKHKNYLEMQKMSTPNVLNFQTPFVVYAMPLVHKYAIGFVVGVLMGLLLSLAYKYRAVIVAYMKEK